MLFSGEDEACEGEDGELDGAGPGATGPHDESGLDLGDSCAETRSPSGCTPDTDGPNHDSDSGIGRDAGQYQAP